MEDEDLLMPLFPLFPMIKLVTASYFFVGMGIIEFRDCSTLPNVFILQHQIRSDDVVEVVEYSRQKML